MSFFRSLYSKMAPNDTIRKDSFVEDRVYSTEVDECMDEDGFVVLTEKPATIRQHPVYGRSSKVEFDNLQRTAAVSSYPPGMVQTFNQGNASKSSTIKSTKHNSSTFLTASDVPMKLARHLEIASTLRVPSSSYKGNLDLGQFYYDFHLEKKAIGLR